MPSLPEDAPAPRPWAREMLPTILVSEEEEEEEDEEEEEVPLQTRRRVHDLEASGFGQAQRSVAPKEPATTVDAPTTEPAVKRARVSPTRGEAQPAPTAAMPFSTAQPFPVPIRKKAVEIKKGMTCQW